MTKSILLTSIIFIYLLFNPSSIINAQVSHGTWWQFQSIDTMKYSRDLARQKLNDLTFDATIETQVKNIAATGATHVAIATPYDTEYLPFLTRWVEAARKHKLNVWFRGNWSGWEGWFDYARISREEHLKKTVEFINSNPDLFREGDVFTPCPECENGGPGDPRTTGDVIGFRNFLIAEHTAATAAFRRLHVQVKVYTSSNADVALLVMDPPTTSALGGIVVIDHYVKSPDEFQSDILNIVASSKGQLIIGEFGVPIPDLHGSFTETQQAEWLSQALANITLIPEVLGLNYWVNAGGSSAIWSDAGIPRQAVSVLTQYFHPDQFSGWVKNSLDQPIRDAVVTYRNRDYKVDRGGIYRLPIVPPPQQIIISAKGYEAQGVLLNSTMEIPTIVLVKSHPNIFYRLADLLLRLSRNIIH